MENKACEFWIDSDKQGIIQYSEYKKLQKRVEELEAALQAARSHAEVMEHKATRVNAMLREKDAENKKLREALSKFSDPNFYWTKPPTVEDGWIVYGRAKKMAELLSVAREALGEVGE